MVLFFGLDLSTQSLKATITTEWDVVIFEKALVFQRDLPHHGTTNGAIAGPEDGEMTCPVALWIESLDRVMDAVAAAGVDMREIVAVSGAAQVFAILF
jgi:xylulokinase